MVSRRQIQNSILQPNLRKTPRGGRMMAKMMSTNVMAPIFSLPVSMKNAAPDRIANPRCAKQQLQASVSFQLHLCYDPVCFFLLSSAVLVCVLCPAPQIIYVRCRSCNPCSSCSRPA
ncbi:hypothetical protein Mapa_004436 [Marchantia paleacea]|nr:hypothetical protein Mapa_004436 [Marchantia paleacea]